MGFEVVSRRGKPSSIKAKQAQPRSPKDTTRLMLPSATAVRPSTLFVTEQSTFSIAGSVLDISAHNNTTPITNICCDASPSDVVKKIISHDDEMRVNLQNKETLEKLHVRSRSVPILAALDTAQSSTSLEVPISTPLPQPSFLDPISIVPYDPFGARQICTPDILKEASGPSPIAPSMKKRPVDLKTLSVPSARHSRPISFIGPLPSPTWPNPIPRGIEGVLIDCEVDDTPLSDILPAHLFLSSSLTSTASFVTAVSKLGGVGVLANENKSASEDISKVTAANDQPKAETSTIPLPTVEDKPLAGGAPRPQAASPKSPHTEEKSFLFMEDEPNFKRVSAAEGEGRNRSSPQPNADRFREIRTSYALKDDGPIRPSLPADEGRSRGYTDSRLIIDNGLSELTVPLAMTQKRAVPTRDAIARERTSSLHWGQERNSAAVPPRPSLHQAQARSQSMIALQDHPQPQLVPPRLRIPVYSPISLQDSPATSPYPLTPQGILFNPGQAPFIPEVRTPGETYPCPPAYQDLYRGSYHVDPYAFLRWIQASELAGHTQYLEHSDTDPKSTYGAVNDPRFVQMPPVQARSDSEFSSRSTLFTPSSDPRISGYAPFMMDPRARANSLPQQFHTLPTIRDPSIHHHSSSVDGFYRPSQSQAFIPPPTSFLSPSLPNVRTWSFYENHPHSVDSLPAQMISSPSPPHVQIRPSQRHQRVQSANILTRRRSQAPGPHMSTIDPRKFPPPDKSLPESGNTFANFIRKSMKKQKKTRS